MSPTNIQASTHSVSPHRQTHLIVALSEPQAKAVCPVHLTNEGQKMRGKFSIKPMISAAENRHDHVKTVLAPSVRLLPQALGMVDIRARASARWCEVGQVKFLRGVWTERATRHGASLVNMARAEHRRARMMPCLFSWKS